VGDFLKVAEILHEGASDAKLEEAMFRTAISRAYYVSKESLRLAREILDALAKLR
jgi:hypothetical protein